jgi:TPR repeat protein
MAASTAQNSKDSGPRVVQVLVALIGAAALILVGYWQYGRPKASENKAALAGRVYSRNESGIEHATLTLSLGNEAARIIKSHEQGTFLFTGLPATAGTLSVWAEGYKGTTRDVTPSTDPQPLEIELEPTAEPQPNAAAGEKPSEKSKAALSHARDEANMGWWHETGQIGGGKDYDAAMRWYLKAVEDGDAIANWNIGRLYEFGFGVPKDLATAKSWYQKAADKGVLQAQDSLANLGHNKEY